MIKHLHLIAINEWSRDILLNVVLTILPIPTQMERDNRTTDIMTMMNFFKAIIVNHREMILELMVLKANFTLEIDAITTIDANPRKSRGDLTEGKNQKCKIKGSTL